VIRAAHAAGVAGLLVLVLTIGGCGGGKTWTARDVPEEYATIQAAVDAAQPGDLVRVGPGVYREQVVVGKGKHDIVIRGTDRNRVVLDGGDGTRFNGIVVHADGIAVENLTVRGYASDGILFTPPKDVRDQLNGWRVSFVTAANNGLHGVEALRSRGGTIDHSLASGHGVAGFRIGNCRIQHHHGVGPQKMIQRVAHLARFEILDQIEMRHLSERMNPRVRAASTRHRHPFAG